MEKRTYDPTAESVDKPSPFAKRFIESLKSVGLDWPKAHIVGRATSQDPKQRNSLSEPERRQYDFLLRAAEDLVGQSAPGKGKEALILAAKVVISERMGVNPKEDI